MFKLITKLNQNLIEGVKLSPVPYAVRVSAQMKRLFLALPDGERSNMLRKCILHRYQETVELCTAYAQSNETLTLAEICGSAMLTLSDSFKCDRWAELANGETEVISVRVPQDLIDRLNDPQNFKFPKGMNADKAIQILIKASIQWLIEARNECVPAEVRENQLIEKNKLNEPQLQKIGNALKNYWVNRLRQPLPAIAFLGVKELAKVVLKELAKTKIVVNRRLNEFEYIYESAKEIPACQKKPKYKFAL